MSKTLLLSLIRGPVIKQRSTLRPRSFAFQHFTAITCQPDSSPRFSYSTSASLPQRELFKQDMEDVSMSKRVEKQELELEETTDEDIPILEKWEKVVKAIENSTKESLSASPTYEESSPDIFQAYWRGVFHRLRNSVITDQTIPEFLTEPPVKKFSITFMDVIHGLGCACCHPEVEPNIILENVDGVTKLDLVDGVIGQLYGETPPRVYMEPDYLFDIHDREPIDVESDEEEDPTDVISFTEGSGVVVYETSWISSSIEDEGNIAYSKEPQIYFYCCKPERYDLTKKEYADAIEQMRKETEEARRQSAAAMKSS